MSGRLFVAVDLDEPARDYVASAIERLVEAGLEARFIAREKWHATVAFLGVVAPERHDDVVKAFTAAARRAEAFNLRLDMVGAFPNAKRPRVVWIGSSVPQPGFALVAAAVRQAFAALGFAFEDDAVPHVTICRIKRVATALPPVALNVSATVRVGSLTLYESVGGKYTVRGQAQLAP